VTDDGDGRPRLYTEQDMIAAELQAFCGGRAAVFSTRCPGKETPCEDSAALIPFGPGAGALVVADGLGGAPSGEQASALAVRAIARALGRAGRDGAGLRGAVLNGMEWANRALLDNGLGAATTVAVLALDGAGSRPFHVGDSVVLVVGQRGRIRLQTVPHSPTGYAVEAGFLDDQEAMHHEERHVVSNVVGSPDMHVTMGAARRLAPRDTVLVASDGLTDNLHLEELVEIIRKGPLEEAARRLADVALERMNDAVEGRPSKPDDLTFVLFRRH